MRERILKLLSHKYVWWFYFAVIIFAASINKSWSLLIAVPAAFLLFAHGYVLRLKEEKEQTIQHSDLTREAFNEALKRYPESHPGLVWFGTASGLSMGKVEQTHVDWAKDVLKKQKP